MRIMTILSATARPAVPKPTVDELAEALYGSDVEGVTAAERGSIIMRELGWEVPGE